jgi:hypothetical protein
LLADYRKSAATSTQQVLFSAAPIEHIYLIANEEMNMSTPTTNFEDRQPVIKQLQSYVVPLLSAVGFACVVTGIVVASLTAAGRGYERDLLENLASAETAFDLEGARSGKMLIETMVHPVSRAVFVPATKTGPKTGVVCATTMAGDLDLYAFGTMSINKVETRVDFESVVSAFCDSAFAKIGEA